MPRAREAPIGGGRTLPTVVAHVGPCGVPWQPSHQRPSWRTTVSSLWRQHDRATDCRMGTQQIVQAFGAVHPYPELRKLGIRSLGRTLWWRSCARRRSAPARRQQLGRVSDILRGLVVGVRRVWQKLEKLLHQHLARFPATQTRNGQLSQAASIPRIVPELLANLSVSSPSRCRMLTNKLGSG